LQVPENGLVVYTGTILTEDGKEKKVNIDFEPFKPINTSLYLCDNKFHTQVWLLGSGESEAWCHATHWLHVPGSWEGSKGVQSWCPIKCR
jgi:hypothetical protein